MHVAIDLEWHVPDAVGQDVVGLDAADRDGADRDEVDLDEVALDVVGLDEAAQDAVDQGVVDPDAVDHAAELVDDFDQDAAVQWNTNVWQQNVNFKMNTRRTEASKST